MQTDSLGKLLNIKRQKVIDAVARITSKRGLLSPTINFDGCPQEGGDLSHYHPHNNTICISERQLTLLNFDEIESVMAHEVTHILVQGHDTDFRDEEVKSSIAGWKPPGGVVHITPSTYEKTTKSSNKLKIDKTRCNYHLCRKQVKLSQCNLCKGYFCEPHRSARAPLTGHAIGGQQDSHPCPEYADDQLRQEKEAKKAYQQALKDILRRPEVAKEKRIVKVAKPYDPNTLPKEPLTRIPEIIITAKRFQFFPKKYLDVFLYNANGDAIDRDRTDSRGIAKFTNIRPGTYTVFGGGKARSFHFDFDNASATIKFWW